MWALGLAGQAAAGARGVRVTRGQALQAAGRVGAGRSGRAGAGRSGRAGAMGVGRARLLGERA